MARETQVGEKDLFFFQVMSQFLKMLGNTLPDKETWQLFEERQYIFLANRHQ